MAISSGEILSNIRTNTRKLESCERHKFSGDFMPTGNKYTCLNCGGKMGGTAVLYYIEGYEAAGGDCNDIYPGWKGDKDV